MILNGYVQKNNMPNSKSSESWKEVNILPSTQNSLNNIKHTIESNS